MLNFIRDERAKYTEKLSQAAGGKTNARSGSDREYIRPTRVSIGSSSSLSSLAILESFALTSMEVVTGLASDIPNLASHLCSSPGSSSLGLLWVNFTPRQWFTGPKSLTLKRDLGEVCDKLDASRGDYNVIHVHGNKGYLTSLFFTSF